MEEDFAQWYTDVLKKADLIDYTSVKGCMVIKPAGYAIWENIQHELDRRFKETGVENVYLPMFIRKVSYRRKRPYRRFAPEVAWVTHGGLEPLQERLCGKSYFRTLFCDFYAKEPIPQRFAKECINWCSVVRWEKPQDVPSFQRISVAGRTYTAHATARKRQRQERYRC